MNISVKLSKIAPNDQESVKIVPRSSPAKFWIASTFITVVSQLCIKYLVQFLVTALDH